VKRILGLALILLLGVAVALGLRYDRGYVLIGYGHWTVETTLPSSTRWRACGTPCASPPA